MKKLTAMSREKIEFISFILFLALTLILCLIMFYKNDKISISDGTEHQIVSGQLRYNLDINEIQESRHIMRGWAYFPGENVGYSNNRVALKDEAMQKYYVLNTGFEQRTDVTNAAGDGYDYTNSGFYTNTARSRFLRGKKYQLCFFYQSGNHDLIEETDTYITPNP